MQKRKSIFTNEILALCNKIAGGSRQYRSYTQSTALGFVNDLSAINMLPMHFKNIRKEAVVNLVYFWQRQELKPKTIQNRLSVFRTLIRTYPLDLSIPSNTDLKINIFTSSRIHSFKKITHPDEMNCSLLEDVFLLQYHFGFKKSEALKFNISLFRPSELVIPRSVSYNRKDRYIPILSDAQKQVIEKLQALYPDLIFPSKKFVRSRALMHNAILETHHITHPDYFRHLYIFNRYTALKKEMGDIPALRTIASETGYSRLAQLKEIITCLKNS